MVQSFRTRKCHTYWGRYWVSKGGRGLGVKELDVCVYRGAVGGRLLDM